MPHTETPPAGFGCPCDDCADGRLRSLHQQMRGISDVALSDHSLGWATLSEDDVAAYTLLRESADAMLARWERWRADLTPPEDVGSIDDCRS